MSNDRLLIRYNIWVRVVILYGQPVVIAIVTNEQIAPSADAGQYSVLRRNS